MMMMDRHMKELMFISNHSFTVTKTYQKKHTHAHKHNKNCKKGQTGLMATFYGGYTKGEHIENEIDHEYSLLESFKHCAEDSIPKKKTMLF